MPRDEQLALLVKENAWKNSLIMWAFPQQVQDAAPHFVQTWIRCFVLACTLYIVVGGLWAWYAYTCFGDVLYGDKIPTAGDMWEQIKVSLKAMPLYSMLPALTEAAAEVGWTAAYPRIDNLGMFWFLTYFVMYIASVEFGVYWMHRNLHDFVWAYKVLHYDHHKYNKEHTLSPFAGLAFHPLDGILQAIAYTWTLAYVPMHFLTHELLLFATDLWTTNIHDCLHGNVWPIMGAGYHLIHHTTYKHNYGHYFVYMDWLFGSLETPEEHAAKAQAAAAAKLATTAAAGAGKPVLKVDVGGAESSSGGSSPRAAPAAAASAPPSTLVQRRPAHASLVAS